MRVDTNTVQFDWDKGNIKKNWNRHRVRHTESEEVFFNSPLSIGDDTGHSKTEKRYFVLGQTDNKRRLFVSYTLRDNNIRIISARPMSRKERNIYEKL